MARFIDNSGKIRAEFDNAEQRALIRIGMTVEAAAKRLCPVDTGRLRNSITFSLSGHGTNKQNVFAKNKKTGDTQKVGSYGSGTIGSLYNRAVYVGTNVEYAPHVELGTVNMAAQPYLKPGAANSKNKIIRIIDSELKGI